MKLSLFGKKIIEVNRENSEWVIYTLGEGTRLKSNDLVIRAHLTEDEMIVFLGDIFHEGATAENPDIKIVR